MEIYLSEKIPAWSFNFKIWVKKMIENMFRNTRRLAGAKIGGESLHNFQNRNLCTDSMKIDLSEKSLACSFNFKIWVKKIIKNMFRNKGRLDSLKLTTNLSITFKIAIYAPN